MAKKPKWIPKDEEDCPMGIEPVIVLLAQGETTADPILTYGDRITFVDKGYYTIKKFTHWILFMEEPE